MNDIDRREAAIEQVKSQLRAIAESDKSETRLMQAGQLLDQLTHRERVALVLELLESGHG